jgi:hypothetical protein
MLVSDFVLIDRPFAEVRDTLAVAEPSWLTDSAVAAYAEGERLCMRVISSIGRLRFSKRVWLELGEAKVQADRITQPLCWRAAGGTALFPCMDAEIEVTPVGGALTTVGFQGSYVPPLGSLGQGADRLLLHRLAEATVRALLHQIARRLDGTGSPAVIGPAPWIGEPLSG